MNLKDKVFVLTGVPTGQRSRQNVEAELRKQGACVENRISARTDFLVYGRSNTVKYKQATDQGVNTLTYDEFFHLLSSSQEPVQKKEVDRETLKEINREKFQSLMDDLGRVDTPSAGW